MRKWLANKDILGELKRFKRSEIDRPARYEQMRLLLGNDMNLWVAKGAGTVSLACSLHDTAIDARAEGLSDREALNRRLILILRKIVSLAGVSHVLAATPIHSVAMYLTTLLEGSWCGSIHQWIVKMAEVVLPSSDRPPVRSAR